MDKKNMPKLPNGKVDWIRRVVDDTLENYVVSMGALIQEDIPEVDFLVPGCIPKGNVVLLVGESGGGKTWIAYDLMRAVATGTKWLNKGLELGTPQKILLLNYDNPTDTVKQRAIKLGFEPDVEILVHTQGMAPKMLLLPSEATRVKSLIEYYQPHLTIVDSFRQSNTYNENDSQEMAKLMSIFKSWTTTESRNTVLLLHHTPKSSNSNGGGWVTNARGSGEITSSTDVVIEVADGKMTWTKARTWSIGKIKETSFEVVDKYLVDDEQETKLRVVVNATTDLPGEEDRMADAKLILIFNEANKSLTRTEIYTKCKPMKRALVDATIKRSLATNKIKKNKSKYEITYELV